MKRTIIAFIIALVLNGCAEDNHLGAANQENGKLVSVKLNFKVPPADAPVSKKIDGTKSYLKGGFSVELGDDTSSKEVATKSGGTTVLNNLWVFQFNSAGEKMTSSKLPSTPVPIKDMLTIDVKLKVGTDQTIYLVAMGSKLANDLSLINSFSALEQYDLDYIQFNDGSYTSKITSDEEMPYAGFVQGVNIIQLEDKEHGLVQYNPNSEFFGGIEMKALLAKISLHYSFSVEGYEFMGVDLKSVASIATINPAKAENTRYFDLKAVTSIKETDAQGRYVYSWYIARNMKGEKSDIAAESDRYSVKAPANSTNFTVWANNNATADNYISYAIYIGKNNTTNFDIEAGLHYILRTDIDMADSNDNRVKTSVVTQEIDFITSNGVAQFDNHYSSRPIIVTASRRKIKVEILNKNDDQLVGVDSWIKVSLDDNYTDAYNNGTLGNSAEVEVIIPGKFKFYLYCDEYVELNASARSLWARVTTTEAIGVGVIKTYELYQAPVKLYGYWGGTFDEQTGEYPDLLACENLLEYTQKFNNDDVPKALPYGYYGITEDDSYEAHNFITGYNATKNLAENPSNHIVNNNVSFEQTRKINDKIDLYQYTIYSNYAARYCYDKNRDLNGNGVIDKDEFKWYSPSINQLMGSYLTGNISSDYLSSTVISNNSVWAFSMFTGMSSRILKNNSTNYHSCCVRDIKQPK